MAQAAGRQRGDSTNGTKRKAHVHLQTSLPWPLPILAQRFRLEQGRPAFVCTPQKPKDSVSMAPTQPNEGSCLKQHVTCQ